MRIEMPANSATPKLDREGPKPENDEAKGATPFFAVIGQMSAEDDGSKRTVEQSPSLTAGRSEMQKKETEKGRGSEREKPSAGAAPSALLASERRQAAKAPDSSRKAFESSDSPGADGPLASKGASPEGSVAQPERASAAGPASPAASATLPTKPAPEAVGSTSPAIPSLEVPGQAAGDAKGPLFWTLSQPMTDTALRVGLTAPVASESIPSLETGSLQLPAEGTPTLATPGSPVNVTSVPQHTLDGMSGAGIQVGVPEVDVMAPGIRTNDRRLWESFDNRQGTKGVWAWGQRGQQGQAQVSPQALQNTTEVRAAAPTAGPESALITNFRRAEIPIEVPDRSPSEAQPTGAESGENEAAGRHPLPDDLASLAVADVQPTQSITSHNQPASMSDTGMPISHTQRPVQDMEAMASTFSAAGVQLPSNEAGSDLKGLSALLAPKHNVPSQEPDFLSQLARRIDMQLRDGENVIRIQLKPSSLGRMEIMAQTSGPGVMATITTESSAVKNYLEHNLHQLQQSFLDQGVKVDRIDVTVQEGFQPQHSSSGSQDSRSSGGQQGESKSPVWQGAQSEWSSEELAVDTQTLMILGPHSTFQTVA
jgi:flagellar hook-length control protein FliK